MITGTIWSKKELKNQIEKAIRVYIDGLTPVVYSPKTIESIDKAVKEVLEQITPIAVEFKVNIDAKEMVCISIPNKLLPTFDVNITLPGRIDKVDVNAKLTKT